MKKTDKEYKITYKTYYNDRLKKSFFHNILMYPLYIQVIFDRIPITFKSYYYDLFSKPKYAIRIVGQVFTPSVKEIIQKEETLIDYIIDKNLQAFSLDIFKKEYAFYSRDLLDIMEGSFLDYLYTFLQDEGLPFLADTTKKGASDCKLFDVVQDMRRALNPALYKKLIENSLYFAPPYLPLYEFAEKPKQTPLKSFTVMEWDRPEMKEKFADFFKRQFPENDAADAVKKIQKWVDQ